MLRSPAGAAGAADERQRAAGERQRAACSPHATRATVARMTGFPLHDAPDAEPEPEGLDDARRIVEDFVTRSIKRGTEVAGGQVTLKLLQVRNGSQRQVCELTYTFSDVKVFAEEIAQAADEDVRAMRLKGKIRYALMAMLGSKMPKCVFMLFVPSELDPTEDVFDNNDNVDPSSIGREAMNQRHTEAFARIIASLTTRGTHGEKLLANLLDRANAKIEQLEQRIEHHRSREDAFQSREFAKKIVLEDRKREHERQDRNMKLLLGIGGVVGAKFLGAPPEMISALLTTDDSKAEAPADGKKPGSTAPAISTGSGVTPAEALRVFAIAEILFGSLERSPDRLMGIADAFSGEEKQALFAIYEIVSAARKRRHAAEVADVEAAERAKTNGVTYTPYNPYSAPT